jgi:hypothetical protein
MNKAFLDPKRPLPTCSAGDCEGCAARSAIVCHFGAKHLLKFFAIALPPIILGGIGIAQLSPWLLAPFVAFALAFFGFIEIRALCSHCPHYAETGTKALRCWANYGSPKVWKYRPGPMTPGDRAVFFGGCAFFILYPAAMMIIGSNWILLGAYAALAALLGMVMPATMCNRCINLACPLNRVNGKARDQFIALNPRSGFGARK